MKHRAARLLGVFAAVSLLLAFVLIVGGCSRSSQSPEGGASLLDAPLLRRVPASTLAFMVWNTENEAFKRYKASPWGELAKADWAKLVETGAAEQNQKVVSTVVKALQVAGLVGSSSSQTSSEREGVAFIGLDSSNPEPQAGVFLLGNSGVNLADKLSAVKSVFTSEGYKVGDLGMAGTEGFSLEIPAEASGGAPLKNLYLAAKSDRMGLATSTALLDRLFTEKADDGLARIIASDQFKRVKQAKAFGPDEFMAAYVDVSTATSVMGSILPEEVQNDPNLKLKEIPVDAIVFSQQMRDGLEASVMVTTTARTDDQKRMLGALSLGKGEPAFQVAPANASFSLSLDGKTIAAIKNAAMNELPADEQGMLKAQLAPLDGVRELAIGLLDAGGASPFPGLIITVRGSSNGTIQSTLKEQLTPLLASTGMPFGQWQDKDLEGTKISYIQSPMVGLGLYLGNTGETLVVGSSEDALRETLGAAKDNKRGLAANLPASSRRILEETKPVLAAYGNFDKIANTIENVQGNFAAFTGGQSTVDKDQVERLRKMGLVTLGVNFDQGIFKIHGGYAPIAK